MKMALRALRRQWVIALALLVATVGASVIFTALAPPTYRATSQVFVKASDVSTPTEAYQGDLFSQQRVQYYAVLAKGEHLSKLVVDDLGLDTEPRALVSQIEASVPPGTSLLNIAVTAESSEQATRLSKAVTENFVQMTQEYETQGSQRAPVRLVVTEQAQSTGEPISPRPALNIGAGFVLGAILALLAAFVLNLRESAAAAHARQPRRG